MSCHALSNQQSAISNQQSAISNQQSAISNQQSAISLEDRAIPGSSIPAALFRRGLACFILAATLFAFLAPLHANAETDICSPVSPNDYGVLQQKQKWYADNWQIWKETYYNAKDTDPNKNVIRDKYIDARLDLTNEYFRQFVSDACGRGALLSVSDTAATGFTSAGIAATTVAGRIFAALGALISTAYKAQIRLYDGLETKLVLNQLMALRAVKVAAITKRKKEDAGYSLMEAEQDLSDLELSSMYPAATQAISKIKNDALAQSAKAASAVAADH